MSSTLYRPVTMKDKAIRNFEGLKRKSMFSLTPVIYIPLFLISSRSRNASDRSFQNLLYNFVEMFWLSCSTINIWPSCNYGFDFGPVMTCIWEHKIVQQTPGILDVRCGDWKEETRQIVDSQSPYDTAEGSNSTRERFDNHIWNAFCSSTSPKQIPSTKPLPYQTESAKNTYS